MTDFWTKIISFYRPIHNTNSFAIVSNPVGMIFIVLSNILFIYLLGWVSFCEVVIDHPFKKQVISFQSNFYQFICFRHIWRLVSKLNFRTCMQRFFITLSVKPEVNTELITLNTMCYFLFNFWISIEFWYDK